MEREHGGGRGTPSICPTSQTHKPSSFTVPAGCLLLAYSTTFYEIHIFVIFFKKEEKNVLQQLYSLLQYCPPKPLRQHPTCRNTDGPHRRWTSPIYYILFLYLTILEQLFFPSFRGSSTTSDIKSHFFSHAEHTADGAVGLCPCVVCGRGANKAAHVQADSHGHQEMVHNSLTLAQNYTQQKNDVVI